MKHLMMIALALCCTASAAAAASPADQIKLWLGTWSCSVPGNPHTATFSPIFGGNGMRISETGKMPSEELVIWDSKSQKWIDQFANAAGMYNTMQGTPRGNTIVFKQVYPPVSSTLMVMKNGNTYKTTFTGMMNGKTMTERETCTRK